MLQRDFSSSGNIQKHHLSVTITIDYFSYAIFDKDGVLIKHCSYPNISFNSDTTLQLLKDDADLNAVYEKISVVALTCNTHQLSFKNEQIAGIIPNLEFKNIKVEKLPGSNVYNYYGLTTAQEMLLNNLFKQDNYQLYNFLFALSTYFIGIVRPLLHIHLEEKLATIYIQKNGTLQFFNSYSYKTANDTLYFIIAACKLTGIDIINDKKTISGWIEKDSEIYRNLSRYLGNLDILEDPSFILNNQTSYKPHYYFANYIGRSCVL